MIRVLTLAYPLTPVGPAACGGTEQIAFLLLEQLARRPGFELDLMAAADSQTSARLLPYPGDASDGACNQAALEQIRRRRYDLIHIQGAPFFQVASQVDVPVLFSLHLARSLYPQDFLAPCPPLLHLQCVSGTQHALYAADTQLAPQLTGHIGNGIDLQRFPVRSQPALASAPLLYLGRICFEKGPHLAIRIARRAGRRLWLVGDVYPLAEHQRYFRTRIEPELDEQIRWRPAPSLEEKRALLAAAGAVLIPSLVEETSSLVAMEAAASGVPALALRRGALPEVIEEGATGYLADHWEDLAAASGQLAAIAPRACRARAERLFSHVRMADEYVAVCEALARSGA